MCQHTLKCVFVWLAERERKESKRAATVLIVCHTKKELWKHIALHTVNCICSLTCNLEFIFHSNPILSIYLYIVSYEIVNVCLFCCNTLCFDCAEFSCHFCDWHLHLAHMDPDQVIRMSYTHTCKRHNYVLCSFKLNVLKYTPKYFCFIF